MITVNEKGQEAMCMILDRIDDMMTRIDIGVTNREIELIEGLHEKEKLSNEYVILCINFYKVLNADLDENNPVFYHISKDGHGKHCIRKDELI